MSAACWPRSGIPDSRRLQVARREAGFACSRPSKRDFIVESGMAFRRPGVRPDGRIVACCRPGAAGARGLGISPRTVGAPWPVATDLAEPAMPAHQRKPVALGAVLAGPFVKLDGALDVDAGALAQPLRQRDGLGVETHGVYPLRGDAVACSYVQPEVGLAGGGGFGFRVLAKHAEQGGLDAHGWPSPF